MGMIIVFTIIFIADIYCLCTMDWHWKPKYKIIKYTREDLFKLDGFEFEQFCGDMFRKLGYKVTVTKNTGDGGKDLILYKDGEVTYVECKRYTHEPINRERIQKLIGSAVGDGVMNCIFITTSTFNSNAYEYVCKLKKNSNININTMDCDELLWILNSKINNNINEVLVDFS